MINIYTTTDYSLWEKYDKQLVARKLTPYTDSIKHEQQTIRTLFKTKYLKTKDHQRLVLLVNCQSDFGNRSARDYKLVILYSIDYYKFMNTDDWSVIGTFAEFKQAYNSDSYPG